MSATRRARLLVTSWVAADLLSFPALLALVAVLGAARGPGDSAKQTMLPELAAAGARPLERVTGIGGTTERTASTVGLALGGVVVGLVGGADALVVTAIGFAASALLGLLVLRPALRAHRPAPAERQGYPAELREGFAGLRRDPVLVGIVVMLALTNAIDQAYIAVLAPAWVLAHGYGPATLGWLFAGFMVTAVAGSVVATALSARLPRLPVYVVGFLLAGLPRFLVLVVDLPLAAVLVITAATGFGAGFLNPILGAVTLERVPPAVRGRVMALVGAATLALVPVGGLLGGVLTDRVGLAATLLGAGLAYFVVTMLPVVLPSWRGFGRRPEPCEDDLHAPYGPPDHLGRAGHPARDAAVHP